MSAALVRLEPGLEQLEQGDEILFGEVADVAGKAVGQGRRKGTEAGRVDGDARVGTLGQALKILRDRAMGLDTSALEAKLVSAGTDRAV